MLNKIAVCVYTQEYWDETMDIEFFFGFLGTRPNATFIILASFKDFGYKRKECR